MEGQRAGGSQPKACGGRFAGLGSHLRGAALSVLRRDE
jgi:hypothetical protein